MKVSLFEDVATQKTKFVVEVDSAAFISQMHHVLSDEIVGALADKVSEALLQHVIGKINVDTVANLATLAAGKKLGEKSV